MYHSRFGYHHTAYRTSVYALKTAHHYVTCTIYAQPYRTELNNKVFLVMSTAGKNAGRHLMTT